jgi:NAD(P)-dependent dehydrogenase (short-subunit alcohol dehydrogenase family)
MPNAAKGAEVTASTTVEGKTVLVTGANRGLGRALIDEALRRGASRVYAGTRGPLTHADERVTPVVLDVTDDAQVREAAERIGSVDIVINNAGVAVPDDLSEREALERHFAVNVYGTYAVTQAFLPALIRARGTVVNVLSLSSLGPVPIIPAYSASKAAAFSITQSLRALYAGRGLNVHAVLPGPIDTDMTRDFDLPKTSSEEVAQGIYDGVERGEEEIFPDPFAESMADSWRTSAAKEFERQNAAMVAPVDAAAA